MKTYSAKETDIIKKWYVVDAEDKILGRLSSKVAQILRGKHKPTYTPSVDMGDNVIVINAGKIVLTGNKLKNKIYYRHTGYPGGIRSMTAEEMLKKKPEKVIELAIKGMLPKSKLGRKILKNVIIYNSSEHPHKAQKPEVLQV